jgi:hypothetical protein
VPGAVIGLGPDGLGSRGGLSATFNAGDKLQFFVNGYNVDKPKIEAVFKKCI